MSLPDPFAAIAEAKRTEAVLRKARAALRRTDELVAETAGMDDAAARLAVAARDTLERAIRDLERRQRTGKLRARDAVRRSR